MPRAREERQLPRRTPGAFSENTFVLLHQWVGGKEVSQGLMMAMMVVLDAYCYFTCEVGWDFQQMMSDKFNPLISKHIFGISERLLTFDQSCRSSSTCC